MHVWTWKFASRHSGMYFLSTSQLQKVLRTCSVLYILTWKCASRHNGVQFFNISTAKSGPELMCFVHFHFKMRFSPQRRAIFYFSTDHMTPHAPQIRRQSWGSFSLPNASPQIRRQSWRNLCLQSWGEHQIGKVV